MLVVYDDVGINHNTYITQSIVYLGDTGIVNESYGSRMKYKYVLINQPLEGVTYA